MHTVIEISNNINMTLYRTYSNGTYDPIERKKLTLHGFSYMSDWWALPENHGFFKIEFFFVRSIRLSMVYSKEICVVYIEINFSD